MKALKNLACGWASCGVYGFIVGPAIDKVIPETNNKILNGIKDFNQLTYNIDRLIFIVPIELVKEGIACCEKKVMG